MCIYVWIQRMLFFPQAHCNHQPLSDPEQFHGFPLTASRIFTLPSPKTIQRRKCGQLLTVLGNPSYKGTR